MHFTLQLVFHDGHGETKTEDVIELCKQTDTQRDIGLSLHESRTLLKTLQKIIVTQQAERYTETHRVCPQCQQKRPIKGYHTLHYRTLFGIVPISSLRVHRCACENATSKTVSPLTDWLDGHNSPELQYIETKWASLVSYGLSADLLKDILPVSESLNAATVRHHLHIVALRQEKEPEDKPKALVGCAYAWGKLPKPGKPMIVGIDGGYVRSWHDKNANFEVIAGKFFSKNSATKRFGFVQKIDDRPRKQLLSVLADQGMQANQQITFLSDGADNLRNQQLGMYPESEHVLDWFHVTMRLTVLDQFAIGLEQSDPDVGATVKRYLESAKWYLWHGNVVKALDKIDDCCLFCHDDELQYAKRKKFYRHLSDMFTYIRNIQQMIPNYGEKYRCGETISTAFVESTFNEVVAKRMVKQQQMHWSHQGAHYLLQTSTAVLNDDLKTMFERWYPGAEVENSATEAMPEMKMPA